MKFEERSIDSVSILDITGEIDLQTSPKLREALQAKSKAKCPKLILNLANVAYLDSSGLATLIEYFQTSRSFQGKLGLCNLTPRVINVFKVARLDQIFTIYPDEATALGALQ